MVKQLAEEKENGFIWLDVIKPEKDELAKIAEEYNLHDALVQDFFQPDHLPKYEKRKQYNFIIFRVHTGEDTLEEDTIQELTDKIAIFYSDSFIITIHHDKYQFIGNLKKLVDSGRCKTVREALNEVILNSLATYDKASNLLLKSVDVYEETVFLRKKKSSLLKELYHLKRKIDLLHRLLVLSQEIIDHIDNSDGDEDTRNMRDLYVKVLNVFASLSENINQLLQIYFSTSSQKTNEIMRILTIFSVFFMPLTFIAGIYGMNFKHMPELDWKVGYPAVLLLMVAVTALIYFWFKRKDWL
jgi:magnesium transporter